MRNLAEITRSRDLPPRRLAGTYAVLYARRALRRHPPHLRILDRTIAYADYGTTLTLFEEIFLRRAYPFRPRRPRPLVVDCGANIGMATLFFKALAPDEIGRAHV